MKNNDFIGKMENNYFSSVRDLIDKMKNDDRFSRVRVCVFSDWFETCWKYRGKDDRRRFHQKLYGFMCCLEAVGFLSPYCLDELSDNILNLGKYVYDVDGNEYYVDSDGRRHYTRDEG